MLTKNDIQQIRGVVREEVKKEIVASEKRTGRKLRKMQNAIIQYHDEYAIYLRKRIEKLEEHTGLV